MAKLTTQEWLLKLVPVFVLLATMVAGWTTMRNQLDTMSDRLAEECTRSQTVDAKQDDAQRLTELSVVEIKGDLKRIDQNLDRLMQEHRTATQAILNKINTNGGGS